LHSTITPRAARSSYASAAPLPDDFDALTVQPASLRASLWTAGSAYGFGPECTFGGAIERVVRASGSAWTRTDETVTHQTMEDRAMSIFHDEPEPVRRPEPRWESLGRRTRDAYVRGRKRLVEKKVLEDGPHRTVTMWREEIVASEGSTLAGDADEFGKIKSHARSRGSRPSGTTTRHKTVHENLAPSAPRTALGPANVRGHLLL
jgi:hypothetical protein